MVLQLKYPKFVRYLHSWIQRNRATERANGKLLVQSAGRGWQCTKLASEIDFSRLYRVLVEPCVLAAKPLLGYWTDKWFTRYIGEGLEIPAKERKSWISQFSPTRVDSEALGYRLL